MQGVSGDEHQVPGFDSPYFAADAKSTLTPQDEDDFIMVGLYMKYIDTLAENVDIARQVLTVECPIIHRVERT